MMGITDPNLKKPVNFLGDNQTEDNPEVIPEDNQQNFTVKDLKKIILSQYQPQSWWRYVLSCTLGRFWDEFKYSVPVYNLLDLCRQKNNDGTYKYNSSGKPLYRNDNEVIEKTAVKEALKKTSWFDWRLQERTSLLRNESIFTDNSNLENEEKLNTNKVIAKVLSNFNKPNS